jgi:hypothetical protein
MANPQTNNTPLNPAEVFMHLIITYLTPMFLATAGGDVEYARMAATEAVKAYKAREHVDLLYIAQIIFDGRRPLRHPGPPPAQQRRQPQPCRGTLPASAA